MNNKMSLREKKKIETRNRIFEVAGRLFKEKGFENTTVDEITREAGIGKGTFFNYYPTKEALLTDFVKQKEQLVYNQVKKELKTEKSIRETIKNILILVAKSNEMDKDSTRLYVFEYLRHYGYEERKSYSLNVIIQGLLDKAAEKGELNKSAETKKAADILTATYFHSLMEWLWSDSGSSFSEDISKKIDMIFDGLGGSGHERKN
jgi:AcrR family transcriptional regulator